MCLCMFYNYFNINLKFINIICRPLTTTSDIVSIYLIVEKDRVSQMLMRNKA